MGEDFDLQGLNYAKLVALASAAAMEEGELAAVSHEATQQLASASGLLPRRVKVPQAVRHGMASFMETPKSYGEYDAPSVWSGVGGQHWVYLPFVKKLLAGEKNGTMTYATIGNTEKKIKVDKLSILRILTDGSFEQVAKAEKHEVEPYDLKARSEAWALVSYLMRDKTANWIRFCGEFGAMPRDMDLSNETIQLAFGRAFDLVDPANPDKVDNAKLQALEGAWRSWLGLQNLEITLAPSQPAANRRR
jgi:hypothetical protein